MQLGDKERMRLDELINAVIDESASEQQIRELQQILEESDLARRHYVQWLAMSASLHHYAGVEQDASAVTPLAPNADGRTHRRGQAGPAFGTSSAANWRRVAYHPACRVAAAAIHESLFRLEPPAGYTTMDVKTDNAPGKEEDLIRTFRICAELGGGVYPNELNNRSLSLLRDRRIHESMLEPLPEDQRKQVEKQLEESRDESERSAWGFTATFGGAFEEGKEPTPQEERAEFQEWLDESDKLTRGLSFALDLPPEADSHYAGQGVSRDTPDRPIFWYRVKETNKYRIIYADLSVHQADSPPRVPHAQPWPVPSRPRK